MLAICALEVLAVFIAIGCAKIMDEGENWAAIPLIVCFGFSLWCVGLAG